MNNQTKPRVGFVGLGKMGTPICKHISAAGYDVAAFVRNDQSRNKAASLNIETTDTLQALATRSNIIVTALTDDTALLDVAQALAPHMQQGSVFIDTSTVSPKLSAAVAQLLSQAGVNYLRSPVSGSTATAEAKQLTVLASGPKPSFDAALPLLQSFSAKQYFVGLDEQARYLKLVLNAMVGATSALLAEALAIGRSGGMDMSTMLEVINNSAVASPLIGYKTRMIAEANYTAAFPLSGMIKDFDLALSVGHEAKISLPLLSNIRQTYEAASNQGLGEQDFFALVKLLD
jgi:3-hydroxyisobutyrate dehydrogenase-like beta-hydroxyacid dehydrogenase